MTPESHRYFPERPPAPVPTEPVLPRPFAALDPPQIEAPQTTLALLIDLDDDELLALDKRAPQVMRRTRAYLVDQLKGEDYLRDLRWERAFIRGWLVLEHQERRHTKKAGTPPDRLGTPKQRALAAALVADYHAWNWADDVAQSRPGWLTLEALLALWGVQSTDLSNARQRTRHHRWEKRYLLSDDREVRKERLTRQTLKFVTDMAGIAPENRNPGMIRAAAELLDDGKKSGTNVNINTGTQVVLSGPMDESKWRERAERLVRYLEVPRVRENAEVAPAVPAEVPPVAEEVTTSPGESTP